MLFPTALIDDVRAFRGFPLVALGLVGDTPQREVFLSSSSCIAKTFSSSSALAEYLVGGLAGALVGGLARVFFSVEEASDAEDPATASRVGRHRHCGEAGCELVPALHGPLMKAKSGCAMENEK